MPFAVRLHFLADVPAARQEAVGRALLAAGVEPRPHPNPRCDAEVVACVTSGPAAEARLRSLAAPGIGRLLLLDLGGQARHGPSAWRLLEAGADDVIGWDGEDGSAAAAAVRARLERWRELDELVASHRVRGVLVGHGTAWTTALRDLVESARVRDAAVLLTGESGTGKELAARLIHDLDPRPDRKDLVILDCATVVPTLSGSEFFGHERGAFTDAMAARDGAFAAADGGTLFLDELGELPPTLQAELLRVVQEGTYKRVGSGAWKRTRFRLVCATNRDLREEVARGRFRSDLYHRVAAWQVRLPSLAERLEDIPDLVHHFLRQAAGGGATAGLDGAVLDLLQARAYPGNVRELRQLVSRLAARHVGPGPITVGDLPMEERPGGEVVQADWRVGAFEACIRRALALRASLRDIGRTAEQVAITMALEEASGSTHGAALRLGISDRALQMRRAASRRHGVPHASG